MRKDISLHIILGGLLLVGHSFFSEIFPEKGLERFLMEAQVFLFLLFLKGHLLTLFLSKKFNIYLGQLFLGFSVYKFIFSGLFILIIQRLEGPPISKSFILIFMFSYFTYLVAEVILLVKKLNQEAWLFDANIHNYLNFSRYSYDFIVLFWFRNTINVA